MHTCKPVTLNVFCSSYFECDDALTTHYPEYLSMLDAWLDASTRDW